jgi:hypothetical protein
MSADVADTAMSDKLAHLSTVSCSAVNPKVPGAYLAEVVKAANLAAVRG